MIGEESDRESVECCPECESAQIYHRVRSDHGGRGRWRCNGCGETFDSPDERERRHSGYAARGEETLLKMDADEFLGGESA